MSDIRGPLHFAKLADDLEREAEARAQQGVRQLSGESAPLNSEDPLSPEVEQSLRSAFASRHNKLTIPASWMGVPSLVGRLHRELKNRCL
eukprot:127155-Karenia_brevis.AAC.1